MTIDFIKMHGLGNDYVFIHADKCAGVDLPDLARRMSHRHLGVGSDGIVLIQPGRDGADFVMRMFNADGTEAETCGNAVRCFAKYVYERGMTDKTEFVIKTGAGPNRVRLRVRNGKVDAVRSNMGKPRFERRDIPMVGPEGRVIEEELPLADARVRITCVNIGNPHAVLFVEDATTAPVTTWGPQIERHPKFPQRTNVEFVSVCDRRNIVMRVWERGAGVTMACGSGACASAVAAMITGRTDTRVQVHLAYGPLAVEWDEDGFVYQEGPAAEVFTGCWPVGGE